MIALFWIVALAILATPAGFWWCCCTVTCTLEVRLRGCLSAKVPGGSVTIGATTISVDSNSNATFTLSPGTYTISGSGPGYTSGSTSVTIASNCTPTQATLTLSPDSDHVCCDCCTDKIARKVLYLTDENGTWTLTSTGGCTWTGTAYVTKTTGVVTWITCDDGGLPPATCYKSRLECGSTEAIPYFYAISCTSGTWKATLNYTAMVGTDVSHDCTSGSLADANCYGNIEDAPSPPGTICSGGVNVAGGGATGTNINLSVDTACGIETLALSGTLSWDSGPPPDGHPTSGDLTVSA
mgnify:CR=1 FL=1